LKEEDFIKTMILAAANLSSSSNNSKFTPLKTNTSPNKNKWTAAIHQNPLLTQNNRNNCQMLSSKKLVDSKCFEYATPKNVYFEGRKVALEDVKHFQTTDEFDRLTYDELH
jgi:hypothetical protein